VLLSFAELLRQAREAAREKSMSETETVAAERERDEALRECERLTIERDEALRLVEELENAVPSVAKAKRLRAAIQAVDAWIKSDSHWENHEEHQRLKVRAYKAVLEVLDE
ncbi:unnamed protein product, partial [marine sediment metagenome]